MKIDQILKNPVLTEKATNMSKNNIYLFSVDLKANKFQVKGAIEKLFKVKVGSIRMMLRKGKAKKVGRKSKIKKLTDVKLAFVHVKEGKIDIFPQT
jgi:large subunit ribosomal protein L23